VVGLGPALVDQAERKREGARAGGGAPLNQDVFRGANGPGTAVEGSPP